MLNPAPLEAGRTIGVSFDLAKAHLFGEDGRAIAATGASNGEESSRLVRLVDIPPKVVRTDAIQSFVSQETPIVYDHVTATARSGQAIAIRSAQGARRSCAYSSPSHLASRLIGKDAERIRSDLCC